MPWRSVQDALTRPDCRVQGCVNDADTADGYCAGHARWLREVNNWGRKAPSPGGTNSVATQAEVTELIGFVRKAGYKVTKSGNAKHWKVLSPKGAVMVDENGPLIISTTPSEFRFREMTIKRLMAAGVLKEDPYKATQSNPQEKGNGSKGDDGKKGKAWASERMKSPAMQEAKVAALKAKSERLKDRTAKLRARFEPIVVKLGGWSGHNVRGLTTTEVADVVYAWAKNRGRVELPQRTVSGVPIDSGTRLRSFVQNLKTPGNTIGEKWLPLFEVFVDHLERDTGTPPRPEKAAERYMEILRVEVKGLSPGPQSPAAGPSITEQPVPPPPPKIEPEPGLLIKGLGDEVRLVPLPTSVAEPVVEVNGNGGESARIGPRYDLDTYIDAPNLALDALYEMASHTRASDTAARERHMRLARQIAELELNQGRKA